MRTETVYAYASRGLLATARGPGKKALYPRAAVETLRTKAAARAGHTAVAAAALRWGEPVLDSAITQLTPRGPVYRGQRAIDLVETPYEQVAERLWKRRADWDAIEPRVPVRSQRPSVPALLEVVVGRATALRDAPLVGPAEERSREAVGLLRRLATAAGPHEALAESQLSIAARVGASLAGASVPTRVQKLINACLVLLADHELNPSTFAARVAASARAPWVDCLVSALGAAAGVRHASACDLAEDLWERARLVDRSGMKAFVAAELAAGGLAGFDAGAYPRGDPRAKRLLQLVLPVMRSGDRARAVALTDAVDDATGQLPAIDFALALTTRHLHLPRGSATMLFVIGRVAGWLAHIEEQLASDDFIRPRARYAP